MYVHNHHHDSDGSSSLPGGIEKFDNPRRAIDRRPQDRKGSLLQDPHACCFGPGGFLGGVGSLFAAAATQRRAKTRQTATETGAATGGRFGRLFVDVVGVVHSGIRVDGHA